MYVHILYTCQLHNSFVIGFCFALGTYLQSFRILCFGKTVNLNSDESALISNLGEEGTPMFDPRLLLCLKKIDYDGDDGDGGDSDHLTIKIVLKPG